MLPAVLRTISIFVISNLVIMLFLGFTWCSGDRYGALIGTIVNTVLLLLFARTKLMLTAYSLSVLRKSNLFIVFTTAFLWELSLLPAGSIFTTAFGGIATAIIIGFGFKIVR